MKTSLIRLLQGLCLTVLISNLMLAQTGTQSAASSNDSANVTDQLKKLQDAMTEQQQQIAKQQQEIEKLRQQVATQNNAAPQVVDASLHTAANPAAVAASDMAYQGDSEKKDSPLSFRIGAAEFTPGGFVDFTNIFRSTNTGNPGGTSFGAIPFSNTIAGHDTEDRMTASNSRLSLKATSEYKGFKATGYMEMDFLGNDATNVFVTSNSHTDRMRLYWVDIRKDKWEFLGGQSWSWLTPNRVGLSPNPSDVFYSNNEDYNYQVGLTWTRAPQFRVAYHPNEHWAIGVAAENPEQYVGAGEVVFPFAYNAQLATQLDANNQSTTPNVAPDIIAKIAYDTEAWGRHFHIEGVGLETTVKVADLPVGGTGFVSHSATGGGGSLNMNLEVFKGFRIIANTFYSDGGGRYIFGLGPQAVIAPISTGGANTDIVTKLVHADSGIGGVEWQATKKTLISAYYGGAYFSRNSFVDITSPLVVKPNIGFGYINSPNTANRAVQEGSFDWTQTFWKHPQYGALQLITEYSYITRSPWFVAAGAPKNAHLSEVLIDMRYVLP